MVKLYCAIVGAAGSAFSVEVGEDQTVDDLKLAIKNQKPNDLKDVDRDKLQLFLAKQPVEDDEGKEVFVTEKGNKWLNSTDPAVIAMRSGSVPEQVKALLDVEVDPAAEIDDLFGNAPKKKTIHVFVVTDREILRAETREPETAPHPSRKRRWDKLNEVLKKNKKAKKSTGFSDVSFREIDTIMPAATYVQTSKPIADEKLDAVHDYFPILLEAFGDIVTAKRLHFIVPVLASVCALFNGDARILAEEKVEGKRVHGDGAFEFVLQRVNKRVCVVVAKRDDIQQGLVQAYVGSEGLADVEGLTKVYSIVTNFVEWYFSRSLDEKIERTSPTTIVMENDVPTRESVKRIAEMLYSILSDDN